MFNSACRYLPGSSIILGGHIHTHLGSSVQKLRPDVDALRQEPVHGVGFALDVCPVIGVPQLPSLVWTVGYHHQGSDQGSSSLLGYPAHLYDWFHPAPHGTLPAGVRRTDFQCGRFRF